MKYEHLRMFCYLCGFMGHTDDYRGRLLAMEHDDGIRLWSPNLRADLRNNNGGTLNSRSLRNTHAEGQSSTSISKISQKKLSAWNCTRLVIHYGGCSDSTATQKEIKGRTLGTFSTTFQLYLLFLSAYLEISTIFFSKTTSLIFMITQASSAMGSERQFLTLTSTISLWRLQVHLGQKERKV